ncbi:hypothetical protein NDU88_004425 [Pleurodeles waltl]|uniref:Uncharacterized protein n=1 Tax=Pleurodeles waltl TaxID=8319 RepID=A0AAV7QG52_PLEWA|nr:hypothetical protein NDU88_004425 [Pleurodeles waltl]
MPPSLEWKGPVGRKRNERARMRGQKQPVLRSEKTIIARGRASQANSRSHSTVLIDACCIERCMMVISRQHPHDLLCDPVAVTNNRYPLLSRPVLPLSMACWLEEGRRAVRPVSRGGWRRGELKTVLPCSERQPW